MPRLSPHLIHHASRISRHLPLLLRECRDLPSARDELRWMKETLLALHLPKPEDNTEWHINTSALRRHGTTLGRHLTSWARRRSHAEPLQYILGTQPFGGLEIKCRPGVLIPRPETETYTTELARVLSEIPIDEEDIPTVADFCTGTGCIALHLLSLSQTYHGSHEPWPWTSGEPPHIRAFDISKDALALAKENLKHNTEHGPLHPLSQDRITFEELDVLEVGKLSYEEIKTRLFEELPAESQVFDVNEERKTTFDIIISNPPYISPSQYRKGPTTKSVRKYEPELALVPPEELHFPGVDRANQFYAALLRIALATSAKVLVMEVGDTAQALRVREMYRKSLEGVQQKAGRSSLIEIWKDDSSVVRCGDVNTIGTICDKHGNERSGDGTAECRAVVVWFDENWKLMGDLFRAD